MPSPTASPTPSPTAAATPAATPAATAAATPAATAAATPAATTDPTATGSTDSGTGANKGGSKGLPAWAIALIVVLALLGLLLVFGKPSFMIIFHNIHK